MSPRTKARFIQALLCRAAPVVTREVQLAAAVIGQALQDIGHPRPDINSDSFFQFGVVDQWLENMGIEPGYFERLTKAAGIELPGKAGRSVA